MSIIVSVAAGVLAALLAFKVVMLLIGAVSLGLIGEAAQAFDIRDQTVLKSFFAFLAIFISVGAGLFAGIRAWAFVLSYFDTKKGE